MQDQTAGPIATRFGVKVPYHPRKVFSRSFFESLNFKKLEKLKSRNLESLKLHEGLLKESFKDIFGRFKDCLSWFKVQLSDGLGLVNTCLRDAVEWFTEFSGTTKDIFRDGPEMV